MFVLPFLAFGLIAAKPAPVAPTVSVIAPAEVAADPANRWTLELSNGSKVVILLRPDVAPRTVYRIQQLTSQHFYDGLPFHRVLAGFMAQGGDPLGTGQGGSKLPDLKAEFNAGLVLRKRLTITGSTLRPRSLEFKTAIATALKEKVWPLIASGAIKPVIHSTFAAADAAKAHTLMESNQHIGKIVLIW